MVNPKELRIGNYVHKIDAVVRDGIIQYSKRLYEISHNDIYHIVEDSDPTNHPIPLTSEWLDRCGFSKEPNDDCDDCETYSITKMDGGIATEKDGWYLKIIHIDGYHQQRVGRKIEYVHQLQNLYFALTGEELTINIHEDRNKT